MKMENINNLLRGKIVSYNGKKYLVSRIKKDVASVYLITKKNFNEFNERILKNVNFEELLTIPIANLRFKDFNTDLKYVNLIDKCHKLYLKVQDRKEIKRGDFISENGKFYLVSSVEDTTIKAYPVSMSKLDIYTFDRSKLFKIDVEKMEILESQKYLKVWRNIPSEYVDFLDEKRKNKKIQLKQLRQSILQEQNEERLKKYTIGSVISSDKIMNYTIQQSVNEEMLVLYNDGKYFYGINPKFYNIFLGILYVKIDEEDIKEVGKFDKEKLKTVYDVLYAQKNCKYIPISFRSDLEKELYGKSLKLESNNND